MNRGLILKYIILCTGILLAGCGQKTPNDTSPQQAAPDQTQQQIPVGEGYPVPEPAAVAAAPPAAPRADQRSSSAYPSYPSPAQGKAYEPAWGDAPPQQVVSVYVNPPLEEPPPVRVAWAPPPMLVEELPPPPSDDAVWIGGYWVWQGDWVWAHGRWARPPRHDYRWENPYYEHRGDSVVFVDGYWSAPDRAFVPPSQNTVIALAILAGGIIAGERPRGPEGVFVPPPPGSRRGLIVPAPIGTPPAVVTSAPPIIREGMHITVNNISNRNTNKVINITNIQQVNNVTLVAPASATATGQAVHATIPTRPHLAAALAPVVKAMAPAPTLQHPIPAYVPGQAPAPLPPPQRVTLAVPLALTQRPAEGPPHPMAEPERERGRHALPLAGPPHPAPQGSMHMPPPMAAQPGPAEPARARALAPEARPPATMAQGHTPSAPPGAQHGHAIEAGRPAAPVPMPVPVPVHPMMPAPVVARPHEHHGPVPESERAAHAALPHAAMARAPEEPAAAPRPPRPAEVHAAPMPEQHASRPPPQVAAVARPVAPAARQPAHEEGKPRPEADGGRKKSEEEKKREEAR